VISGGTLPTKNSEGGYGSAGEQPERLRSGGEGSVPPSYCSASREHAPSRSNSLPPNARNSRPEGGIISSPNAVDAGGVVLSNTPPLSSISNPDPHGWTGAEDWIEWSLSVNWPLKIWKKLRADLEEAKTSAAQQGAEEKHTSIAVRGRYANVSPCGVRAGKGNKGLYFAYSLEYDGIRISIADKKDSNGKQPNLMFRASGEQCLLQGAHHCYEIGNRFVRQLGGQSSDCKLSRVDICLDMPGTSIDELMIAFNEKRYITRTKARGYFETSGRSFFLGKPPLVIQAYDKLAEVNTKANPTKKLAMIEYRWNGEIPANATRVEFQIRREALKTRGINSVEDYFEKRADLIFYLTHNWIRFLETIPDRKNKNQSKIPTLEIWKNIQDSFQNFAGGKKGVSLAPLEKEKADVGQMIKQAFGVLESAARHKGLNISSWDEFNKFAKPQLKSLAGKRYAKMEN